MSRTKAGEIKALLQERFPQALTTEVLALLDNFKTFSPPIFADAMQEAGVPESVCGAVRTAKYINAVVPAIKKLIRLETPIDRSKPRLPVSSNSRTYAVGQRGEYFAYLLAGHTDPEGREHAVYLIDLDHNLTAGEMAALRAELARLDETRSDPVKCAKRRAAKIAAANRKEAEREFFELLISQGYKPWEIEELEENGWR